MWSQVHAKLLSDPLPLSSVPLPALASVLLLSPWKHSVLKTVAITHLMNSLRTPALRSSQLNQVDTHGPLSGHLLKEKSNIPWCFSLHLVHKLFLRVFFLCRSLGSLNVPLFTCYSVQPACLSLWAVLTRKTSGFVWSKCSHNSEYSNNGWWHKQIKAG